MSTLPGATANKLMTNTWLDSRISPVYNSYNFLTFNITWKITYSTYTITRTCTYKAVKRQDDKIIYVLTKCTYVAGITDANYSGGMSQHARLMTIGHVLSKIYLPIIDGNISISNLLSVAEFLIESTSAHLGNLSPGLYTLSQIQTAIKRVSTTITVNNLNSLTTIEKTIYDILNAGVEYGGNCVDYRGVPPSEITNYINRTPEEDNSSRRAITQRDFFNIFRNVDILNYRCEIENIDTFNNVTFYPIIGTVYTNYTEPDSYNNGEVLILNVSKTNTYTIIPPTLTGLDYWNGITGNYTIPFTQYLRLYRANENVNDYINIGVNDSGQKLNANDIAFNYKNITDKTTPTFRSVAFFRIYTFENTNDMYGASQNFSSINSVPLILAKNRKVYPGDIHERNPYITPRIAFERDQSIPVNIYNIDYLTISDASQHYQHPTINRSLTASDGLSANNHGEAIVPVIYIPSTIRLYRSGTCSYTLNTSGQYPIANVTFSRGLSFFVYRYAYGNRGSMANNSVAHQVLTSEIYDLDTFMSQLNSGCSLDGAINFTQTFDGTGNRSRSVACAPTVTFTASTDRSGYLIITANASSFTSESLYIGSNPRSTVINSIYVNMTSTGIDGFLLGPITSNERTTDVTQRLWYYVNTSTGSGTSSASTLSLDDDGIDTADFVIGSFDEFDE